MTDTEEEVLAANRAFYQAFARRDFAAMAALWAEAHPVVCVHPGWPAIFTRQAVLASWRGILANPSQASVACREEKVLMLDQVAMVVCVEALPGAELSATNIFVREGGAWRLAHHQAGPRAAPAASEATRHTLH